MKLGPPAAGEVIIKVDPRQTGAPFTAGTLTLLPGAEFPLHRHLHRDEALFVHRGQGRATLQGRSMTVVPGTLVYVPRQAWQGLRNTGTGLLQLAWTATPPGLEDFFRELARLGSSPDAAKMEEVARRHSIEFSPPGQPTPPPNEPRTRPGARPARPASWRGAGRDVAPRGGVESVPRDFPVGSTGTGTASSGPPRRRRHRRKRGGRGKGSQAPPTPPQSAAPAPAATASAPPQQQPDGGGRGQRLGRGGPPPSRGRSRGHGRGRRGRVKEVYMGGRWVQVAGEGPVIAQGPQQLRKDTRPNDLSPGSG
ncbi:MAG: cupin domain-containing protein [Candidatus Omnitrophica bacterium]|nr:cupin domain-containing protein [Candidatus Omnitrophota bacterium]MBI3083033.1 cupin domain-containing protein [Candidatus Omnitrophota bacterium]